jgi:hypothetical protein
MVIAALLTFGVLLAAWIVAPSRPRQAAAVHEEPMTAVLAEAA